MKFTEKIPNDTISVRSDLDEEWSKKLQDAFIEIGKNEEGHKIIKKYIHMKDMLNLMIVNLISFVNMERK